MPKEKILLVFADAVLLDVISRAVLLPAGFTVSSDSNLENVLNQCKVFEPDGIIFDSKLPIESCLNLIREVKQNYPATAIVLFANETSLDFLNRALKQGVDEFVFPPVKTKEVLQTLQLALSKRHALQGWAAQEALRNTQSLQHRLDELETLGKIGRSLTATLNIDSILASVVEAAVGLTNAEEGSLLLLDSESQELYMRAAKNFGEEFVQTFRLPLEDTVAEQVIQSGEAILLNADNPQKIKNAYMVQSLLYTPLRTHKGVIGVLGVDNRMSKTPFQESHVSHLQAIADYAAIAIENAELYASAEIERRKLNTILTKVVDGVIVVDHERNIIFINPTAKEAFGSGEQILPGKLIYEVISHPDLLQIFYLKEDQFPCRRELTLDDGRIFNAQATRIAEIGVAITLQDITQIKELDRIKSDFVSTVSHDLRSPLTAILGYIELLERVGPLNDTQREFVQRVNLSVQNITNLINELLDLGRIEAGFDTQKEFFDIESLIQLTIEDLREQADDKNLTLLVEIPNQLPKIFASTTRIQQVMSNLIENAIKYTRQDDSVKISARLEAEQLIFQVIDNGPGIPIQEQPYIFDRFYRAANSEETTGTGLGLAIVKSIVENNQGRVWVESQPGQGTTFTVVMPVLQQETRPVAAD